jgi:hypothetical protein
MPPGTEISTTRRFAGDRRKAVKLATAELAQERLLVPDRSSALVIEPASAENPYARPND